MSEWFYAVDGVQYGPVAEDVLRGYVAEGRVRGADVVWRDGMPEWVAAEKALAVEAPFFAVGIPKLILMSILTVGLYEVLWFYWNWRRIKQRTEEDLWPVPRAAFAVLFFHPLMKEIEDYARERQFLLSFSKAGLTLLFFLLNVAWQLPQAWWLIGFASVIPLAIVQRQVNALHQAVGVADRNSRIRGWNWLAVALGVPLILLAILGSFMPEA